MLLYEHPDGVVCIGQAAHAWVSGRLARAWGNDAFAAPDPFEDVCLGAEQHDVGMAEWDRHPERNPETGLPRTFMQLPLATHLDLWANAPHKIVTQSPYAALLVSQHGHALYARRTKDEPQTDDERAIQRFVDGREAYQKDLVARLGEDPDRARRNQKLVWALDYLSLAPIMGWVPETVAAPTRPGEPDARLAVDLEDELSLTVDPWPFGVDSLTLPYHGRLLDASFETAQDLHAALDRAPWVRVNVTWLSRSRPAV